MKKYFTNAILCAIQDGLQKAVGVLNNTAKEYNLTEKREGFALKMCWLCKT
jgi:hypothetical protein